MTLKLLSVGVLVVVATCNVAGLGAGAVLTGAARSPVMDQAEKGIDGKWDVSAESPHGKLTMELDLKVDGETVTGTLLNFRGQKQPVKGTFKKGALTLEAASGDEMAFSGTLKHDGTLAGQLSTPMGDVTYTATRPKKAQ